jgi:hypothetical protein
MAILRAYGKPVRSLVIAIAALFLSLFFKMIEIRFDLGIAAGKTLSKNELIYDYGLLSVHYELILISFILLAEAHFSLPKEKRGTLSSGWAVLYICTIVALTIGSYTRELTPFTIGVRDGLGLITIGLSVHAAREG